MKKAFFPQYVIGGTYFICATYSFKQKATSNSKSCITVRSNYLRNASSGKKGKSKSWLSKCLVITTTLTFLPPVQGIDFATRKIAKMLKPQKVIKQDGDSFHIHTTSTFRDYVLQFKIGEEFEEDNKGLDNRKCKVRLNV